MMKIINKSRRISGSEVHRQHLEERKIELGPSYSTALSSVSLPY